MFDYDGKNIKTLIRKDVKLLQEDFGLGPAHVFRTKRGFHVIFMCDMVSFDHYQDMLKVTKCCKGFKKVTLRNGYAVLRVSAKYTEFDIEPEYVLPSKGNSPWRKLQKAHLIEALYSLGHECGTHFASLFPNWANFQEDQKPWKEATNRKTNRGKRLKKLPKSEPLVIDKSQPGFNVITYNNTSWTGTFTTATTTTNIFDK